MATPDSAPLTRAMYEALPETSLQFLREHSVLFRTPCPSSCTVVRVVDSIVWCNEDLSVRPGILDYPYHYHVIGSIDGILHRGTAWFHPSKKGKIDIDLVADLPVLRLRE